MSNKRRSTGQIIITTKCFEPCGDGGINTLCPDDRRSSVTVNDDLITWNSRWRLSGGFVTCKTCDMRQPEREKPLPFPHSPTCIYATETEAPWAQLDDMSKDV